jgi:DNA transformation protein
MAGAPDPFVEHCVELLAPAGPARARRMFGGHGLYVGDLFVGLVAGERLYLKADAASAVHFAAAGCEPFVYRGRGRTVRMSFWSVPPDALESPALMQPWARLALQAALGARAAASGRRPRAARSRA